MIISNKSLFYPVLASLLLSMASCKNDPQKPVFDQNKLIGRWELQSGWRNGRQTQTLTGTYYQFLQDGKMKTNLTPSTLEAEFPYSYSDNQITQKSEPPAIYSIDSLTDSVLVFNMTINNVPFRLEMIKATDSTEVDSMIIQE
jgi:hypothetical protein